MTLTTNASAQDVMNPYDFANPVRTTDLFVGRDREWEEVTYYLDECTKREHSFNLALLGERAAGKTSLLNMIELEASERALLPVRINLNESDVDSHLTFWFKLFDAVFTSLVSTEDVTSPGTFPFNGPSGQTYDTYLDIVSAYTIPDSKEFCPFVFPVMYAKAMSAGNVNARVSDTLLIRDLTTLSNEARRPIVLLIDECNVLSRNRALLEMMRNTFMNLPGFMLVFTGTPDLFPVMDDVFSPIVRQFKRIEVGSFKDVRDTAHCVREPLNSVNLPHLFSLPDDETLTSVPKEFRTRIAPQLGDLHELTAGRPYEIQLVCHFMFRRVQLGLDARMRLSMDVLDDVLRELRQTHDEHSRPIIAAVRTLDRRSLHQLHILSTSAGVTPLDEVVLRTLLTRRSDESETSLLKAADRFVENGILRRVDECLEFAGDDFDRIVCKYAARKRDISLSFHPVRFCDAIHREIVTASRIPQEAAEDGKDWGQLGRLVPLFSTNGDDTSDDDLRDYNATCLADWDAADALCCNNGLASPIYSYFCTHEDITISGVDILFANVSRDDISYVAVFAHPVALRRHGAVEAAAARLDEMRSSARKLGATVEYQQLHCQGMPLDVLLDRLLTSRAPNTIASCAHAHTQRAFDDYIATGDVALAVRNAERAAKALRLLLSDLRVPEVNPMDANVTGYVLLRAGRHEDALSVLRPACETCESDAILKYNCAIGELSLGNRDSARHLLEQAQTLEMREPYRDICVLLIPKVRGNHITLEETRSAYMESRDKPADLSLNHAIEVAMDACDAMAQGR